MHFKQEKGFGFAEVFIVLIVLFVLVALGIGLWSYIHKSVLREVIFWLILASPLVIWLLIKYWFDISYELKRIFKKRKEPIGNYTYDTKNYTQISNTIIKPQVSLEDSVISLVKQFKPMWNERNGKRRLEGGENGNNAFLAQYLRDKGISKVETELTLKNRSRADLLIDNQIVIECKKHLLSIQIMNSVSSEVKRIKRLENYKAYALIYGDAKADLLEELKSEIGTNNVICLGKII